MGADSNVCITGRRRFWDRDCLWWPSQALSEFAVSCSSLYITSGLDYRLVSVFLSKVMVTYVLTSRLYHLLVWVLGILIVVSGSS
jgi:hypothetical protein